MKPTVLWHGLRSGDLLPRVLLLAILTLLLPSRHVAAASDVGTGDLYALIVGVSKYKHPKIKQLKVSDKDAKDFADFLKSQNRLFRNVHVTLLRNEEATKKEVETHLYYKLRQAGKDDTVVLFFSGHGADDPYTPGEFFFLTYDAEPEYLAATAVHMSRQWFLSKLDSKRVILIADACHAGGFSVQGAKSNPPSFQNVMQQFKESEGRIFLTSSRPDELSMEKPGMPNSVFTHYLLQGLKGEADADKDGVVTIKELYDYVYKKTKDETKGYQRPQMEGRLVGQFPLSLADLRAVPSVPGDEPKPSEAPIPGIPTGPDSGPLMQKVSRWLAENGKGGTDGGFYKHETKRASEALSRGQNFQFVFGQDLMRNGKPCILQSWRDDIISIPLTSKHIEPWKVKASSSWFRTWGRVLSFDPGMKQPVQLLVARSLVVPDSDGLRNREQIRLHLDFQSHGKLPSRVQFALTCSLPDRLTTTFTYHDWTANTKSLDLRFGAYDKPVGPHVLILEAFEHDQHAKKTVRRIGGPWATLVNFVGSAVTARGDIHEDSSASELGSPAEKESSISRPRWTRYVKHMAFETNPAGTRFSILSEEGFRPETATTDKTCLVILWGRQNQDPLKMFEMQKVIALMKQGYTLEQAIEKLYPIARILEGSERHAYLLKVQTKAREAAGRRQK